MLESILDFISALSPFWIYVALFFFAFIENVFPPSPSDLVVVVGGSLIVTHSIEFIPTLILTSLGSVLGFMVLFFVGSQLDKKVVRAGKIKFLPTEGLDKVEHWFTKYGYLIILINRFLPGTRSVISLFGGLSELDAKKTAILATISAFAWNSIIIYLGILFGKNIAVVDKYLSTYSNIVLGITALIILIYIFRYFISKRKRQKD